MGAVRRNDPWQRTYRAVWRREERFLRRYRDPGGSPLDRKLEELAPEKLMETLHGAFVRAFGLIFEKGAGAIARAGRLDRKRAAFQGNRCAADLREDRKTLRAFSKAAGRAGRGNVLLSGAAGVGMGLLGIALPDVLFFTAVLLKSIYETAASYGYDCAAPAERVYVLRLLEAALSNGEELAARSRELDAYAQTGVWARPVSLADQMNAAARRLSETLVYGKFLQNIPIVGAAGGAGDAVCMDRVRRYAAIKYQKRFLLQRRLERNG